MMKITLFLIAAFAMVSYALQSNSDWQSLGGLQDEQCSINLIESDTDHIVVDVTVPGFWLGKKPANKTIWDCITLPEFYSQVDIGLPEVPNIAQMFALPFGAEPSVIIEDVQFTTYSGINLVPMQTAEIDMPHAPFPFCQDETAYRTNSFLPSSWAETISPGIWGGINVDRLLANPFRYNPVTRELMVAKSLRIRINFSGSVDAIAFPSTATIRNSASRILINYDMVDAAASASSDAEGAEYLFVTTKVNISAIMPLVEFYQGIGYRTSVLLFDHSRTDPNSIKNRIRNHYDSGITRFVLIAGDALVLPSPRWFPINRSDYWYGCLTGDDYMAELAIGRLTGDTTQISHQVDKIINGYYRYDFSANCDVGVVPNTVVLAAHAEEYPGKYTSCCNQVASASYAVNMNFHKIYPTEGGTNAMVSEWINKGIGSVGYRGHGKLDDWSWSAPKTWRKTNIEALTNTFMPPIWNICCTNGDYTDGNYTPVRTECISESFAWAVGGSSGNLGAGQPSRTYANHTYLKQIYLGLYKNANYNVGETINEGNIQMVSKHGDNGIRNAKMYVWFGDPAMEIFTNDVANPTNLEISCKPGQFTSGPQTFTMTVTSLGTPVSGATVALSDGIDGIETITFFETETTNASGVVSFTVNVPVGAKHLYTGARLHNYGPVATQLDPSQTSLDETISELNTVALGVTLSSNPVIHNTAISFSSPRTGHATIQVIDITGRVVDTLINEEIISGTHSINWAPGNISSGVYFVHFTTSTGSVLTQAMILH